MGQAVEYFCGKELAASTWENKYALRDDNDGLLEQTPDDMHRRIARELARIESIKFKEPYSEQFIYELLKDFGTIIPQGSPMYGIGNKKYVTLSNCYVVEPPTDSYGGICHTDEQLVQICKRRGGCGTDVSAIRPSGFPTTNSSRTATGIVPFMERFSNSIREVGQNGRRGALMLTISVHHPQVLYFARSKLDKKKITGANISIRLSDEFLNAVEKGETYEQRWPVDSAAPKISRRVDAREVWGEIVKCAWSSGEPGLLFWDKILRESPADCYSEHRFQTVSTNPCSELPLCVLDSCRLMVINLFSCVRNPFTKNAFFDFGRFDYIARITQRLMDDIVDLELESIQRIIDKIDSDPEHDAIKQKEWRLWMLIQAKCEKGRRTGTGITALGDTLAALGLKYGSDEAIAITEQLYRELKLSCYRQSVEMAKKLGPFPIWKSDNEKDCPFLLRIRDEDPQLYADMQKYGRRNIALLTTAPAGSISIFAGPRPYFETTSGVEPLFKPFFTRRVKVNHADKNARVDFTDVSGDKWTHHKVYHPKLKMWMDLTGENDWTKSPYFGSCAEDLDWQQRVKLQAAAQRHIDHGISSTINLPANATEEDVAMIYEALWKAGCKGGTVYREGSRDGVLIDDAQAGERIQKTQAPKRPKDLPCDIHFVKVKSEEFFVVIGCMQNEPYEVFAGTNDPGAYITHDIRKGLVRKPKRGEYQLIYEGRIHNRDLSEYCRDSEEALTRMVSTSLRHGADISFIVHQLEKVKGDLTGFAKALARVLKKYVKDGTKVSGELCGSCGQASLIRQEGCVRCTACGWSKC